MVKQNAREIARLGHIEEQTNAQEVRIKQRDEEMRAIKFSLDELKERVTKVENNQVSTGEARTDKHCEGRILRVVNKRKSNAHTHSDNIQNHYRQ